MLRFLFLPLIIGYLVPSWNQINNIQSIKTEGEDYKGTKDLNIKLVQRDLITNEDAQLFKHLFFSNQNQEFSYQQDGDSDDNSSDEECYDDRLPTKIIIYKGERNLGSDKEMVDRLRDCGEYKNYAIIGESNLFGYDPETVDENYAIKIESLQRKLLRHSVIHYLDSLNNLVYIVNGTQINLASMN